ncbi:2-pyrone-4,6-dicarboxylate hydrolase (plasmid) [Pseudorhodobacter turbinis]|uniref:2-pyrone-4,6-dicarboxylate hydrolase n=1 Tax=Pseudorhodobacter turbinis TaxID=2500533 RepID=A0A4V1E198_9RHOB|nr:amidohydrolase family protein [Pseudorhodobacter turbinis]QCO57384.1 2-pyrone-4,6-dicarboxylate hydrolase [Pseudorhodobacter turbinis]
MNSNANPTADHTATGICDCHVHVFDEPENYPFENAPAYEPPYAPVSALRNTADEAGIERLVLVQPTPYGRDLGLLLKSLNDFGDQARGIGVADATTTVDDLARMKKLGIRGLRFVENRLDDGTRMPGTTPLDVLLDHLAPKLAEIGMHAEIWAPLPVVLSHWSRLSRCGVRLVLDHMGSFDSSLGVNHEYFQRLLSLTRDGDVSVKLSICRRPAKGQGFDTIRPFHDALVEANAGQLLWATDFPFVRYPAPTPDVARLLSLFRSWINDTRLERQILLENPSQLYWANKLPESEYVIDERLA